MIQSNELRIGNYVNTVSLQNIEVTSIFTAGIHCENFNGYDYKLIKPIKINESWLLKFGFVRQPWGLVCGELLFKDDLECNYLILEVGNGFKVKVKYIHELQNLYLMLTGIELKNS